MSSDDEVGYKKPPKRYQFEKGKSGNPNGRPRQKLVDSAAAIFDQELKIEVNGVAETVTVNEALNVSLLRSSMDGNRRASKIVIENAKELGLDEIRSSNEVTYVKHIFSPEACYVPLLKLGVIQTKSDVSEPERAPRGPFRITLWVLEQALRRLPKDSLSRDQIERIARSCVSPRFAMIMFGKFGYPTFELKPLKPMPPRPPSQPRFI